jgi:hypothetical protein
MTRAQNKTFLISVMNSTTVMSSVSTVALVAVISMMDIVTVIFVPTVKISTVDVFKRPN